MPRHHNRHPDPTANTTSPSVSASASFPSSPRPDPEQHAARLDEGGNGTRRRLPPSSSTAPFTCTFCWLPSAGPPHVLWGSARGTRSLDSTGGGGGGGDTSAPRLACSACHAAVLDLAVCWVCGELVCRGDECVSLGWCFVGPLFHSSSSFPYLVSCGLLPLGSFHPTSDSYRLTRLGTLLPPSGTAHATAVCSAAAR